MEELKEKTKEVVGVENIVTHTLGSQENAFENVKPTYNGEQVVWIVLYFLSELVTNVLF